ncbi:hypothetical protein [Streptosporangium sp. G12]
MAVPGRSRRRLVITGTVRVLSPSASTRSSRSIHTSPASDSLRPARWAWT